MFDKLTILLAPLVTFARPTLTDVQLPGAVKKGSSAEAASNAVLTSILDKVYLVAGIAAVIVIIIGGILYATSDGQPDRVKRAKNAIIYASVGLVIVLLAFGITGFVSGRIRL